MVQTKFTKLLGTKYPIQQAAIGSLATPELAVAVDKAGGFGMVSATGKSVEQVIDLITELKLHHAENVGFNFILPFTKEENLTQLITLTARNSKLVEFFYDIPRKDLIDLVHDNNALASWQVGSYEEALIAVEAGVDIIVLQGREAGGHIRGRTSLFPLIQELKDEINLPIIASGGIGNGAMIAAALIAGADGVRIGTRFVAALESPAHPDYVKSLISSRANSTVISEVFNVGWKDALHRTTIDSLKKALRLTGKNIAKIGDKDIRARTPISPTKDVNGRIDALPHWAGEGVGSVKRLQSAQSIIDELINEFYESLKIVDSFELNSPSIVAYY